MASVYCSVSLSPSLVTSAISHCFCHCYYFSKLAPLKITFFFFLKPSTLSSSVFLFSLLGLIKLQTCEEILGQLLCHLDFVVCLILVHSRNTKIIILQSQHSEHTVLGGMAKCAGSHNRICWIL